MKMIAVVALALVAIAAAAPPAEPSKILRSEFNQQPEGGYSLIVETDDGTNKQEEGIVKEVLDEENKPHSVVVVRGSYSYINPDGQTETITYVADEKGFQPEGPSIPKVVSRR